VPRILSAALVREKNQVASSHVLSMLLQADIPGAPVPYRLVNYDQEILFHGIPFIPLPFDVDALEDPTSTALVRLRITVGNVDQGFISLLENYWGPDTPWNVTIWQIDTQQPDETPFTTGEVFQVAQVNTDFLSAVVDVIAEGITLGATMPKRRYTTSGGFPGIPRRLNG
jgi:hypothetical protein